MSPYTTDMTELPEVPDELTPEQERLAQQAGKAMNRGDWAEVFANADLITQQAEDAKESRRPIPERAASHEGHP